MTSMALLMVVVVEVAVPAGGEKDLHRHDSWRITPTNPCHGTLLGHRLLHLHAMMNVPFEHDDDTLRNSTMMIPRPL